MPKPIGPSKQSSSLSNLDVMGNNKTIQATNSPDTYKKLFLNNQQHSASVANLTTPGGGISINPSGQTAVGLQPSASNFSIPLIRMKV